MVAGNSNMMTFKGLVLTAIAVTVGIIGVGGSPHIRELELDPTDICLFTCDSCFTGETLVRCANECIVLGGDVGPLFKATCQNFEQNILPIFPLNKNKLHK